MKKKKAAGSTGPASRPIVPSVTLAPALCGCNQPAYALSIDRVFADRILLDARPDDHTIGDFHKGADIVLVGAAADQQWAIASQGLGLAYLADVGRVASHAPRDNQRVGAEEARPFDMGC